MPLDAGDPYCASLWHSTTIAPVKALFQRPGLCNRTGPGHYATASTMVCHFKFRSADGLRTHHTLLTTVVFLYLTGVCWPTSTDSFPCAPSPSHFRPGGATSSGAGFCSHPPLPAVDWSAVLSACRQSSLFAPASSPASDCWRRRPRVPALMVLPAPGRPACSAGFEFIRGSALRYLGPRSASRGLPTRRGQCGGALPLGVATFGALLPLRGLATSLFCGAVRSLR